MADKDISTLTAGTQPTGTEKVVVTQGVNSRRLTLRDIASIGAALDTVASTTHIPAATDVGKWIRYTSGSAVTVTFNTSIFAAGEEIIFEQAGAGTVTFAAGSGFTLLSAGSLLSSNGQYTVQGIKFLSDTTGVLFGNLA